MFFIHNKLYKKYKRDAIITCKDDDNPKAPFVLFESSLLEEPPAELVDVGLPIVLVGVPESGTDCE